MHYVNPTEPQSPPAIDTPASSPAGRTARARLTILGVWTLVGLFETSKQMVAMRLRGATIGWDDALIQNMPWWYAWAILTPAIAAVARRYRLDVPGRRWIAAPVHLTAALVFSAAHILMAGTLFYFTTTRGGGPFLPPGQIPMTLPQLWLTWAANFIVLEIITVAAVTGIVYALDYAARYRESAALGARLAAQAAELRLQVASARLHALRMELNPHFLFNTLNAISGLVRKRETEKAVGLLARLGTLLRETLDRGDAAEMPVREELALLSLYLEIERTRFADRLTIDVECPESAADALVPTLVLQPIVENAIRHGIVRRPGPGSIRIAVTREGDETVLTIANTGGAVEPPGNGARGVGLANTRARLRELYGEDASLALASGGGITRATIRLPFHLAERESGVVA